MTYIVGAKCKDGVVLIGDRKVSIGETEEEQENKLIRLKTDEQMIVGASGSSGLFEKFIEKLESKIEEKQEKGNYLVSDIIEDCEDISYELTERYFKRTRGEEIDVLTAIRTDEGFVELYIVFGSTGFSEPVKKYKAIGHGEPFGSIFLKQLWNKEITMKQFAKIAYLIIYYIEELKLDSSVGYEPQIWFIPEVSETEKEKMDKNEKNRKYPVREANKEEIKEMEAYSKRIFRNLKDFITIYSKP